MWIIIHVIHIAIDTAETFYLQPSHIYILCLFFVNVKQTSMNLNGCNIFHIEEFVAYLY